MKAGFGAKKALGVLGGIGAAAAAFAQETIVDAGEGVVVATEAVAAGGLTGGLKYISAALAVGLACIASGAAVAKIGSAAMGAMSENPELSGKALPFAGLAEGICLWGFLVALLIIVL
jgi:V/A-type H+-transporting ATPase subunit K